eukprot:2052750-Ditylum_brightwellii.AAC.1
MEYQHHALCKPSADKAKGEKPSKSENAGKLKAEDITPTKPTGKRKFYCNMHGRNRTHDTDECFELNRRVKRAKPNTAQNEADK